MVDQDQTPRRSIEELSELRLRAAQLETTLEEQRKGEEGLRENEDRFRTLFETLTLGVVYQDHNGEILRANPAAERILGLTLDQMQGRTSLDPRWRAIHEDGSDFPGETHPGMQVLETGREAKNVIMGVYHPAKEDYVWINIQAVPRVRRGEDRPYEVYATFEDITDKKHGQDEIKLLARFPGENPNPVMRVRGDGAVLYGNQASSRLLRHWEIAVGQQVPEEIQKKIAEALGSGTVLQWDIQVQDRHFALTMTPVAKQEVVNVYGLDISELKKAEKVVQEREERIRFITENMVDMLSQVDSDLVIRYISPSHQRVLGYRSEELIGQSVSRLVHPEDRDETTKTMRQVIRAGGPTARLEYRYRKADGQYLWVETLATFLYRPAGGLAGIIFASRDIGERKKIEAEQKQLEENLKREKEKFQILVDASPLGVSLVGPDGRYKYVNPKFTEIFGYTLKDIPEGRDWFRRAYPDESYRREVIAQWMKDLREVPRGESRPRTFKVICKDGTEKVILFSPVSMETGDQLVIYEDITERKKLEIQLIQAQKMEAVGTLAGGIAHDFNNLLMAIQGNVSLMLMDLPSQHPDRERLQHIESCVRSGADLTRQLLGFARRGRYQIKPTELNELIDKASAMFGRTQKGIRIHKKFAEALWTVEVDRGQMEQVLLNLLVNAWQAMPRGGDLYLETQN
ncbi:MAG TPA: PAS domain S-box protein, partial [Thermodesulfobacteriota bacterium]|nr:PAS domain S-box protein [Thermodesulfobacteriota bacterium]